MTSGFRNWNDGRKKLRNHEGTKSHQSAVTEMNKVRGKTILEKIAAHLLLTKEQNNRMLVHVINALKYLSRQDIATRGRYVGYAGTGTTTDFNLEPNSNFNQVSVLMVRWINGALYYHFDAHALIV